MSVPRCFCPCHHGSLHWYPPPVTHPVESLAACELCEVLHRGVWTIWKRPRVIRRWVDPDATGEATK